MIPYKFFHEPTGKQSNAHTDESVIVVPECVFSGGHVVSPGFSQAGLCAEVYVFVTLGYFHTQL